MVLSAARSAGARAVALVQELRPVPATAEERAAQDALRAEVAGLPGLPVGSTPAEQEWLRNRADLREQVRTQDARAFLSWRVLQDTMVVPADSPYVVDTELPALREAGWVPFLSEDVAGGPSLVRGTAVSGNVAHHAFHLLAYQRAVHVDPWSYDRVVELGAGYGSMCRLLYRLSVGRMRATLFDLPEFSALQRYFLSSIGITAEHVNDVFELTPNSESGESRLLLATWSLSEMPLDLRSEILKHAGEFDAYLIAYQDTFNDIDNLAWFAEFVASRPDVDWAWHEAIAHLDGHHYLFGTKRS